LREHRLAQYSARIDVLGASQRRYVDREHVQPVEEVRRLPLASRFFQVPVGGRHDTCVGPQRLAASHALELALLEDAQQGDLDRCRQFSDLVEEDRAPGGQLEAPTAPFQCAREGALLVPEQLRGDERFRERGAVDLHHRALRPSSQWIARRRAPSRPRLAGDQHRRVGRRDESDPLQHTRSAGEAPMIPPAAAAVAAISSRSAFVLELRSQLLDLLEGETATAVVTGPAILEDRDLVGRERRRRRAGDYHRQRNRCP
jgi:hypothetical protein